MFKPKALTVDQMERMVAHDALRRFPPVARSEFNAAGRVISIVAKMKSPNPLSFEFLYLLNGEIVPRTILLDNA